MVHWRDSDRGHRECPRPTVGVERDAADHQKVHELGQHPRGPDARPGAANQRDAVHLPACRADADAHLGKGCAVLPTLGAIMPEAVWVDIGCGMIAVRTQFAAADLPTDRKPLREAIEAAVPLSAGVYNQDVTRDHTVERIASLRTARRRRRIRSRRVCPELGAAARNTRLRQPLHRSGP